MHYIQCYKDKDIPREFLLEASLQRLRKYEGKGMEIEEFEQKTK
jgi:hypothetical protein